LKLEFHKLLSVFPFNFSSRHYTAADSHAEYSVISELKQTWAGEFAKGYVFGLAKMSDGAYMSVSPTNGLAIEITLATTLEVVGTVGRCRLPVSKPVLKAPMVSALEARI